MSDPERISRHASGLSGQLLRAGLEEQPSGLGMERTLAALGISGAIVASTAAAHAAASGMKLGGAAIGSGAVAQATSTVMLVKWIGIGLVGGVGLAGIASVATSPTAPAPAAPHAVKVVSSSSSKAISPTSTSLVAPLASAELRPEARVAAAAPPRAAARVDEPLAPALTVADGVVAAPLAAEVALVDRARAALGAGRSEEALSLVGRYEREFSDPRLLPEALFLKLEACERLGRPRDARAAAQQLLTSFPRSPHAARARKLLEP